HRLASTRVSARLIPEGYPGPPVSMPSQFLSTPPRRTPRRIGPTWTQFLRLQAYGLLSPGAPSEEDDGLESLVAVPQRKRPLPISDVPAIAGDPSHAPSVPTEQLRPSVGAFPYASETPVPPRAGTRARDGPAMAA
ncbi:MAG TPA: hypothetical protein VEQ37_16825, partial [Actinomycetota bacterium]|nr:hypothetical protein [Actinomycetota bacterium]